MRKAYRAVVLSVAAAAIPALAHAQVARPQIGAEANYQTGAGKYFGVGGRVEYGLASLIPTVPQLRAIGQFDYFFASSGLTDWEINVNAAYTFPVKGSPIKPYAGAGVNYIHVSISTPFGSASGSGTGLNLLGGVQFKAMSNGITPFVEARLETQSAGSLVLTGGLLF